MAAADIGDGTVAVLRELVGQSVGVLLGAGASSASGLPGWDDLAVTLLVESGAIASREAASKFLENQDPILAAEAARSAAGEEWIELVRKALYGSEAREPSELHRAAADFIAQQLTAGRRATALTLNFDLLLEAALNQLDPAVPTFPRGAAMPRAPFGSLEVHHLHGVLPPPPEPVSSPIVLTLGDYSDLTIQRSPWQLAALQEHLQHGPLLLAGTTYRDTDVRQWLHGLHVEGQRSHGLYIFFSRASLDLGRREFEAVRPALVGQWEAIGVTVVAVEDHGDIAQLFRELVWLNEFPDDDYVSPKDRARSFWEKTLRTFETSQREHAEILTADVIRLQEHLGGETNLTLWLSDGEGRFVRWATSNRVYTQQDSLLRIEAGFDSDWIVGEALAADETRAGRAGEDARRRWRSVAATPVVVRQEGGPPFSLAALSAATTFDFDDADDGVQDQWIETLADLSREWGERLTTV